MVRIVFLGLDIAWLPCHLAYEYYIMIAEKRKFRLGIFLM